MDKETDKELDKETDKELDWHSNEEAPGACTRKQYGFVIYGKMAVYGFFKNSITKKIPSVNYGKRVCMLREN